MKKIWRVLLFTMLFVSPVLADGFPPEDDPAVAVLSFGGPGVPVGLAFSWSASGLAAFGPNGLAFTNASGVPWSGLTIEVVPGTGTIFTPIYSAFSNIFSTLTASPPSGGNGAIYTFSGGLINPGDSFVVGWFGFKPFTGIFQPQPVTHEFTAQATAAAPAPGTLLLFVTGLLGIAVSQALRRRP